MFIRKSRGELQPSYSFRDTEASRAKPAVVGEVVRNLLRDDNLWAVIEPYTMPPGVCGSRQYDQANVVRDMLEFDAEYNEGRLASFGLSDRAIWQVVYRELPKAGFKVFRGRIVGLLEDKSAETDDDDNGADDTE